MNPDFYTRIEEASNAYHEAADKRDKECEDYWNALPIEEQEKARALQALREQEAAADAELGL